MPQARTGYQVEGSLINDVPAMGGADYNAYMGTPNLKVSKYITAVPRDKANLEAEGGETVFGDINGDGMPEHKIIKGPRHSKGGVPLNLPDDSFIYSDTSSMKIKDPNILAMFNKPAKKSGYTPAELAKSYDLEKYRKILQDPNSDMIDRKTAELMLRNYNVKLAQLALAQEAKKGFPQGIPKVAMPALQAMGLKEEQLMPMDLEKLKGGPQQEMPQEGMENPEFQEQEPQEQEMAEEMNQGQPVAMPAPEQAMRYGGIPMAAKGLAKVPCPQGTHWDPQLEECVPDEPMPLNPSREELFNNPQYREYLDKLEYKRDVDDYKDWRQNQFLNNTPVKIINPGDEDYPNDGDGQPIKTYNRDSKDPQYLEWKTKFLQEHPRYDTPGWQLPNNSPVNIEHYPKIGPWDYMDQDNYDQFFKPDTEDDSENYDEKGKRVKKNEVIRKPGQLKIMMDKRYDNWCPCSKKQEIMVQGRPTIQEICVPCEETPMAMYGMEMGGYDMPFNLPQAEYGMPMGITAQNYQGRPKYAGGGEGPETKKGDDPKYKVYTEQQVKDQGKEIKSSKDPSIKVGDYVKDADGSIRKITAGSLKQTISSETAPGTRADFINANSANKAILDKGDVILEKLINERKAYMKNGKLNLRGDLNLPFEDKIALSRALNSSQEFASGKYVIGVQHRNDPYSKMASGRLAKGSFVAGFTPEDYEKRYLFERAKGLGNTDEEALKIVNDTYDGGTKQAKLRKEYLSAIGKKNLAEGKSDADLLNPTFYKTNYAAVTEGVEQSLGESGYRPKMGNEGLSGFEHFDAAGYKPDFQYEAELEPCKCEDGTTPERDASGKCPCKEKPKEAKVEDKGCECTKADGTKVPSYKDPTTGECSQVPCQELAPPTDTPAPWWLQDTIKTTALAGDLMGIKKYMPWAPDPRLVKPRPTFLDPTRELAQQSEQANMLIQGMGAFAGPQALSARASSVQGQSAKSAADTLSRYNNANVNIANQFELKRNDIDNQETLMRQASQQKLYDQNTIANQQYDNSKRAIKNALTNQYTNAITNRWQTHALNQMYPQFNVDPSVGGRGFYTGKERKITPGSGGSSWQDAYSKCKQNNPEMSDELLKECAKNSQSSSSGNNDLAAYNAHYGSRKKKGGSTDHPGFLYGDVTYPFIL